MKKSIFIFLLVFMASAAWAKEETKPAAEPSVSIKAELNRAVITIGDPVEFTVTIKHDPAVQISSDIQPPPAQDILKMTKTENINYKDGKFKITGKKFIFTSFKLGEFVLDPVEVQYKTADGKTQILATDPIYMKVKSVAEGEEKTDIRGIKSVLALLAKPVLLILLGAAALVMGALLALRFFRKKPLGEGEEAPSPLSPEEEALLALSQLFDSDLLRRGKVKDYYLRFSEILKTFFEKRFQIAACEATTYEIVRALREKGAAAELITKIDDAMNAADLAKFAKWVPEPPQIVQLNQKAKQIIEDARPKEAPNGI